MTRTNDKGWPKTPAALWAEKPAAPKIQSMAEMAATFEVLKARSDFDKTTASRRTRMQKE